MAASPDESHPDHVVRVGNVSGVPGRVSRAAALYGANASGKSNLVKAMYFARRLIVQGTRSNQRIAAQPFRLGNGEARPSRFQFQIIRDDVLYEYGFVVDNHRVHQEWLFATEVKEGATENLLFERETDERDKVTAEFGSGMDTEGERGLRLRFVTEGTRPNQLLLTECGERNVSEVETITKWFNDGLTILSAEPVADEISRSLVSSDERSNLLLDLLGSFGTGIMDITQVETQISIEQLVQDGYVSNEKISDLEDTITGLTKDRFLRLTGSNGKSLSISLNDAGSLCAYELYFARKNAEGKNITFTIKDESDGTRRFVYLYPALWYLRERSKTFVIDELDRRLHSLLTRRFIELCLSGSAVDSQLIFTTHDTNLIDLDLLRADEIWFAEKNQNGATHLSSLSAFRLQPRWNLEKGYLNGRFGAIPFTNEAAARLRMVTDGDLK